MTETNRRWILAERPKGEPDDNTLRLEEAPLPRPAEGQMLLRVEYLSLDPYMRGRMSAAKSYAKPVELGTVMEGGAVARVVSSNHRGFAPGDMVLGNFGWQDYALSDGSGVQKLEGIAQPSWALGILGMPRPSATPRASPSSILSRCETMRMRIASISHFDSSKTSASRIWFCSTWVWLM